MAEGPGPLRPMPPRCPQLRPSLAMLEVSSEGRALGTDQETIDTGALQLGAGGLSFLDAGEGAHAYAVE